MFLLFSDQSNLSLFPEIENSSHDNFVSLCESGLLSVDAIKSFQKQHFDFLVESDYVAVDDGRISLNRKRVDLLKELFDHQVACSNYMKSYSAVFDSLEANEDILIDSSLFSIPEQDYLEYLLSNKKFGNNLELRNRYIHDTPPLLDAEHQRDYIQFLKIMVLIIIKINEEFCLRDMLINQGNAS